MTKERFAKDLLDHDWWYDNQRDPEINRQGFRNQNRLLHLCQQTPEFFQLYNHAERCVINQQPITFPAEMLQETPETNHNTPNTDTPMNPILDQIFAKLIVPLIEAIDRLTAATAGSSNSPVQRDTSLGVQGSQTEAEVTDTPAAAPAKAPKKKAAEKPAPVAAAPAPEPEPAEAEEPEATYTLEQVKSISATLPEAKRDKMREWMKTNLNAGSLAMVKEENYGDVVAALLHLGAKHPEAASFEL